MSDLVRAFETLSMDDVAIVGGKNASLGELVRELIPRGVSIPGGFAVTADAYRSVISHNRLGAAIVDAMAGLDLDDVIGLQARGRAVRALIQAAELPPDLVAAITEAYTLLSGTVKGGVDVAVRSSATAEDLPEASFAGQQETYLNVRGIGAVLDTTLRCMASLFTDRAISYREERGFGHMAVGLSVGIQRMVRSDLAGSGVIFTLDTETGFRDVVLITAAWGLGENVVQGAVTPDEYLVFKPTLATGHRPILQRRLGPKAMRMVYDEGGGRMTRNLPTTAEERGRFVLSDDEVLELARQACLVEEHYSARAGRPTPMDLEWAKDGLTGELFIVQARPETVHSQRVGVVFEQHVLKQTSEVLATGQAVGDKVAVGAVRVIRDVDDLHTFREGEILVAERTDPDWEPVMRIAAGIVTETGGRTCHAAIVSRELGVPAVVGAGQAADRLATGHVVTIDCATDDVGRVYEGALPFDVVRLDASDLERPRTHVMLNVGDPSQAFRLSRVPNDGVGLVRQEFIAGAHIGVHPMAAVRHPAVSAGVRRKIDELSAGWPDPRAFYVGRLAEGIGTIAAAFYPKPVIVRLSDFKSNEYRHLVGGEAFEGAEANPMIGYRGASRYRDPEFAEAFALECQALVRVREVFGFRNVKLMVPFCRTPAEGRDVLELLAVHGLQRGRDGLEVYVMCEIPSNALLAPAFAELFDGFSIGSNDLTQLTLGIDRDSERLAPLFDEQDPAVKALITMAIRGAHAAGRPIGICGQAPSDHPEFAAWLVEQGIDSVSLTADAVLATTRRILACEEDSQQAGGA